MKNTEPNDKGELPPEKYISSLHYPGHTGAFFAANPNLAVRYAYHNSDAQSDHYLAVYGVDDAKRYISGSFYDDATEETLKAKGEYGSFTHDVIHKELGSEIFLHNNVPIRLMALFRVYIDKMNKV